jgi:pimeloyl-ACP methyl ester carboxylesterase
MSVVHDLVLVPGLNNTAEVFDDVVAALPASVRGHAVDNPPLETVEAIADALLPGLPPRFWLAGFSFGGYVALAMLQRAPGCVQGIALVCPSPSADTPAQAARRADALRVVEQGRYLDEMDAQAGALFLPGTPHREALIARRRVMVRRYGPARYAAHVRAALARPDREHLLDGRHPVRVIGAAQDALFPPAALQAWVRHIPGAGLDVIEGAEHRLPMEQPQALADVLARWVSQA